MVEPLVNMSNTGMSSARLVSRGAPQGNLETLAWSPDHLWAKGCVPEALRTHGRPWMFAGDPGGRRYGLGLLSMTGYLHICVLDNGQAISCAWPTTKGWKSGGVKHVIAASLVGIVGRAKQAGMVWQTQEVDRGSNGTSRRSWPAPRRSQVAQRSGGGCSGCETRRLRSRTLSSHDCRSCWGAAL